MSSNHIWTATDQRQSVYWACALEVFSRKPGNVHRSASFPDLQMSDFLRSAEAIAPVLASAPEQSVGMSILRAIQQTRANVQTNTNLGIVLLLTPLCAVPFDCGLSEDSVRQVLQSLTIDDARQTYAAIRWAQPGGLGQVSEQDVANTPTVTLLESMRLAAQRDTIAAQYVSDFGLVWKAIHWLSPQIPSDRPLRQPEDYEPWIIRLALWLMANVPDALIARKCGADVAREASRRAAVVLSRPATDFDQHLSEFDAWLRADGHRRNPGTTADLVAAILYSLFRQRIVPYPFSHPLSEHQIQS